MTLIEYSTFLLFYRAVWLMLLSFCLQDFKSLGVVAPSRSRGASARPSQGGGGRGTSAQPNQSGQPAQPAQPAQLAPGYSGKVNFYYQNNNYENKL